MGGEGEIEVEVRDNGGPLEGAEKIFEPFQGPKSGLGLAIAQRVIEAHLPPYFFQVLRGNHLPKKECRWIARSKMHD
jgi:hypothetical protein